MLDSEQTPAEEPEVDGEDQVDAGVEQAESEAPEEAELSITIGSEAPDEEDAEAEAELGEKGRHALQAARKAQREAAADLRKLKARMAEIEAAQAPKIEEVRRPTLEECGFDDDTYAKRMEDYVTAQAEVKARTAQAEATQRAAEDDYKARHGRYTEAKAALRVEGYDEAEEAVRSALSREQQSMLIRNLEDPAKVVYALGRSKKTLAELAAVKDMDRFAFRLAKIEGEIKVTTKTPPPAESRLKGGGASGAAGTLAQQLAAAEKVAERTGNRTEVIRLKQQMLKAGAAR